MVGRSLGIDPLPVIGDGNFDLRADPTDRDLNFATFRGEFDGIVDQVPCDLLQAAGVAADGRRVGIEYFGKADILGVGGRAYGFEGRIDDRRRIDRLHVEPDFSRDNPGDVKRSEIICAWARALRSMASTAFLASAAFEVAVPQELGPAHDRIERRPQLVRERSQKIVLEPIGAFSVGPSRPLAQEQLLPFVLAMQPRRDIADDGEPAVERRMP